MNEALKHQENYDTLTLIPKQNMEIGYYAFGGKYVYKLK